MHSFTDEELAAEKAKWQAEERERYQVSDMDHYCTPGCEDGCDIARVRVWHREEVIERRKPLTEHERQGMARWFKDAADARRIARQGGSDDER